MRILIVMLCVAALISCDDGSDLDSELRAFPQPLKDLALKYPTDPLVNAEDSSLAILKLFANFQVLNMTTFGDYDFIGNGYTDALSLENAYLDTQDLFASETGVKQRGLSLNKIVMSTGLFVLNTEDYQGAEFSDWVDGWLLATKNKLKGNLQYGKVYSESEVDSVCSIYSVKLRYDGYQLVRKKVVLRRLYDSLSEKQKLYHEENMRLFLESLTEEQSKLYREYLNLAE